MTILESEQRFVPAVFQQNDYLYELTESSKEALRCAGFIPAINQDGWVLKAQSETITKGSGKEKVSTVHKHYYKQGEHSYSDMVCECGERLVWSGKIGPAPCFIRQFIPETKDKVSSGGNSGESL